MKKGNLVKILYNIYSFIFIFTMINREFLFFGIDLRYINVCLGAFLIFISLLIKNNTKKEKHATDNIYKVLILLYVFCLISNVNWLFNNKILLNLNYTINTNILLLNNLFAIIIYHRYINYYNKNIVCLSAVFSCSVLALSIILIRFGFTLEQISGAAARFMVSSSELLDTHTNLFGGSYRIAGYAEDANYATLFFITGIISMLQLKRKYILKIVCSILFFIGFAYSFSKTIAIAMILGIIYIFILKIMPTKKVRSIYNKLFIGIISFLPFALPKFNFLSTIATMGTRFKLWKITNTLFLSSPIIGSGIDASKSFINMAYNGLWFVQTHSTFWQLLADTGIVGFIIFIVLMYTIFNNEAVNYKNKYLLFVFLFFAITCETIQLQIFVFITYIILISKGGECNE